MINPPAVDIDFRPVRFKFQNSVLKFPYPDIVQTMFFEGFINFLYLSNRHISIALLHLNTINILKSNASLTVPQLSNFIIFIDLRQFLKILFAFSLCRSTSEK
ncbi:Uncharacterised protein [Neisseria gonorrhoeae]|uniref:Uncharacterized protein n=1 Tax=Neisseria gonorrhoeae TaxID=485 RepID=A0A378W2F9_NEIGO|nr:Uncharacterised protein [Neisseria gonorrhoeae]